MEGILIDVIIKSRYESWVSFGEEVCGMGKKEEKKI